MTFAHPLPWWALLLTCVAAAAVAWLAYREAPVGAGRRWALSTLRFVSLIVLVLLLMRPVATTTPDGTTGAVVPILVDTSRSMSIEDVPPGRRIDRAREVLQSAVLPALQAGFQTEVLAFGEAVSPVAADALGASGRRSDLGGALRTVRDRYRDRPVAGIVLVSDGGDTGGAGEAAAAAAGAPVFAIGIGPEAVARDREVLSVSAAEAVLDNSRLDLSVMAVSHGYGRSPIELRLLENGRPIEVRRIAPAGDGVPVQETFQVTPGPGAPALYSVEIPPAGAEAVPENNVRSVLVQPPSRRRRVLLVQGAPGFEGSFLRRAWSADPGLEVDAVVRKGQNDQGDDTFYIQAGAGRGAPLLQGYPTTRDHLFAYDAVVLANVDGALLSEAQLEATRDFVGVRGGGLLVLGAQSFLRRGLADTALDEVLPLQPGGGGGNVVRSSAQPSQGANRVALTPAGEAHPVTQLAASAEDTRKRWQAVPALAAISPLGAPRPGATVLAETTGAAGTRALLAVQRYGEGRAMVFAGEAAWRWRMMLPADDSSYDTFWRQAIRWTALRADTPVAITAAPGVSPGEEIAIRVAARTPAFEPLPGATVDVRVTAPDGRVVPVPAAPSTDAPGMFEVRVRAEGAGVHRLTADVQRAGEPNRHATTSVLVGGADLEMTDPRANARLLQRVALASGGRLVQPDEAAALAAELRAALPPATLLVRRDRWHGGWSFALVATLLAAEWLARRRWGMQ